MFSGRVVLHHIHKKWKDSLEGSLVQLSFVTELEFSKILVPRLPQNISNGITESTRTLKLYYLSNQLLGVLIYLHFTVPILIDYAWWKLCNKWLLLFVNNSRSLTLEEKHCCSYYSRKGDR